MAIEASHWPWKPSLFNQYRIRIANELRLAQCEDHCNELRRQISLVEEDISQILQQTTPIDFVQVQQKVDSCCRKEQKRTFREYHRVRKQLIDLTPKLLIGNAYLYSRDHENLLPMAPFHSKKKRKRLKLTIEQQWKKGIADAYRKFQIQRDQQILPEPINSDPLPILADYPPIIEHEFLAPLPPPPLDEIIIPFQTPSPPPIACRSPPSDRLQLAVDDTIVKPHRLVNKTLGNISHMSFHIDPEQCSSPKADNKKKKAKLLLPPAPPPPPLFSSTTIFDTHAFFTQTNNKTKKQKKKIDISRPPVLMINAEYPKKKGRPKRNSPYDFQDDDHHPTLARSKVLSDDMITARFAKNSHYQSHQSSMASNKSNKIEHKKTKKKKKNLLGIGSSSPLTLSTNLTLSPGRLSTDDDCPDKSSRSKAPQRTKKNPRTRVK